MGEYNVEVIPNNSESSNTFTLSIIGTQVNSARFAQTFSDASTAIHYNPQSPTFVSPSVSYWTKGKFSEFHIGAENHSSLSVNGLPEWLEFNSSSSKLFGTPTGMGNVQITLTAINPAFEDTQNHNLSVFDPSIFVAQMDLTPTGVLSPHTVSDVPGLFLRLDASTIEDANGTQIRAWNDSSGNGRHLNQYRGRPMVTQSADLNDKKVVYFDGYSQLHTELDVGALLKEYSLTSLIRHTGEKDQAVISSIGSDWVFGLGAGSSAYWKMSTNQLSSSPVADQSWHVFSGTVQVDGKVCLWRDGFLVYEGARPSNDDYKPSILALGGSQANDEFSTSEVAELLLYDRGLNHEEIRQLEDHLRLKWMSGKLNNFPILVRLSSGEHPDFDHQTFADGIDGSDLRVFDESGVELAYEIDEWNNSSKETTLWVQVKEVSPVLILSAYWGNESNQSNPDYRTDGSVWEGFAGVWHFSDFTDSSINGLNLTKEGNPQTQEIGNSGYAISLDGENDYLQQLNYNLTIGNTPRTIETWIKSEQTTFEILGWGSAGDSWNLGWNNTGPYLSTNNSSGKRQGSSLSKKESWNHLVVSYPGQGADLDSIRIYLNGQLVDLPASSITGPVNTGGNTSLILGGFSSPSSLFEGLLDETRLSTAARSHGWARLSYENQRADVSFFDQTLEYLEAPVLLGDINLTFVTEQDTEFRLSSEPPATIYELSGSLPSGLSFNPATGVLSGSTEQTGTFTLTASATNAKGSSVANFVINSVDSVSPPVLSAGQVIRASGRKVELLTELVSSGGASCDLTIFWGKSDGSETPQAWDHSLNLGSHYQSTIPIELTDLESGASYVYRLRGNNPQEAWSAPGSFTTLPYDQGTLRISTGLNDSGLGAGWFWDKGLGAGEELILAPQIIQSLHFAPDGSSWTISKAKFAFEESIHIGPNLDGVILEGVNSLSIHSTGGIVIATTLTGALKPSTPHTTGGTLIDGYDIFYQDSSTKGHRSARGNLGGYGGGQGPGKGLTAGKNRASGASGGGGSYGGEGGPAASGASGIVYGSANLSDLIGGSGGGLGNLGDAGAGGGAIELVADGKVLIESGAGILMSGGTVFVNPQVGANYAGGAGSGGAIRLVGSSVENLGVLDVRGGNAPGADPRESGLRYLQHSGGAGGGGRVALLSDVNGTIFPGVVLTDGGSGNSDGRPGLPGSLFEGTYSESHSETLFLESGTLLLDTSGGWSHNSGLHGKGRIFDKSIQVDGNRYDYKICEFRFAGFHLGKNAAIQIKGNNSLRIVVEGNVSIASSIHLNGRSGTFGVYSGQAGPGGWNSGRFLANSDFPNTPNLALSGMGPGGGKGFDNLINGSAGGSHGGFGSPGSENGLTGNPYGDSNLTHLIGGSGGARPGGVWVHAGGGGGAISILAQGDFTLEQNTTISVNGGLGGFDGELGGGGGAGGSIRIEARNITNHGLLRANGGNASMNGGAGGGGRIALITEGTLLEGNVSVSAGENNISGASLNAQDGVISRITSPTIDSIEDIQLVYLSALSPVDLGLQSGLSYSLSGQPEGVYLDGLKLAGTPLAGRHF